MNQSNNPRDALVERCQEFLTADIVRKELFFDAPQDAKLHNVDRLLVLMHGNFMIKYSRNGEYFEHKIFEPMIVFSSAQSYFWDKSGAGNPTVGFSFSYFPAYIRAMVIDYDGVERPPTERDIFYHTTKPLSEAGRQLLDTLKKLHNDGRDDIAAELLTVLLRLTVQEIAADDIEVKAINFPKLWSNICNFIHTNCNKPLSREMVAQIFRITPNYVSNLCRKFSGKSFSALKQSYQFEFAEKLLKQTNMSIKEIALECGFSTSNYFVRSFKKVYGITPNNFRNDPDTGKSALPGDYE